MKRIGWALVLLGLGLFTGSVVMETGTAFTVSTPDGGQKTIVLDLPPAPSVTATQFALGGSGSLLIVLGITALLVHSARRDSSLDAEGDAVE